MAIQTLEAAAPIEVLRALADPTRLEICRRLAAEELCVCHLVADLGLAQPLISHHLKALREAGLVHSRQHSYWTYYRLRPGAVNELLEELMGFRDRACSPGFPRPCC